MGIRETIRTALDRAAERPASALGEGGDLHGAGRASSATFGVAPAPGGTLGIGPPDRPITPARFGSGDAEVTLLRGKL